MKSIAPDGPQLARFDVFVVAMESLCNSEKLWTLNSGLTLGDGKPTKRLERLWQLVVGHYSHVAQASAQVRWRPPFNGRKQLGDAG